MSDVVVKFLVVLVGNLALGARPEGALGVQPFRFALPYQPHRHCKVIGIGLDDLTQPRALKILLSIILQVQRNARTSRRRLVGFCERKSTSSIRFPSPALAVTGAT